MGNRVITVLALKSDFIEIKVYITTEDTEGHRGIIQFSFSTENLMALDGKWKMVPLRSALDACLKPDYPGFELRHSELSSYVARVDDERRKTHDPRIIDLRMIGYDYRTIARFERLVR